MISLVAPSRIQIPRDAGLPRLSRCERSRRVHQREIQQRSVLRGGHREACAALAAEHGGRMLAVARRILRSEEDAADAVQDAFLSACASIHRFQANSQLSTWLHRIVVNACLMKLRARKRRPAVSLDALPPNFDAAGRLAQPAAPQRGQAAQLEQSETRAAVRRCIDRLPHDYREIVMIRDIEELDTNQTARVLGLSRPAVKTRLHRARQALRTLLEREAAIVW
jgi:RNA polymerase sigma-70 factor, ECF subfamily